MTSKKYMAGAALMLLVLANVACYVRCEDETEAPPAAAPEADAAAAPSSEAPKVEEAQADQATGPPEAADTPSRPPSAAEASTPPPLVHHQEAAETPAAPAALPEAEQSHTEKGGHNNTAPALWPSVSIALSCALVATSLH